MLFRSQHWQPFYREGFLPALDRLEYVARAITPPGGPRRFDARFFLADAADCSGSLRGNGELEDLAWVPLDDAPELPLSEITGLMLLQLKDRLRGNHRGEQPIPFYRMRGGREVVGTE